jgi:hypothetical protein
MSRAQCVAVRHNHFATHCDALTLCRSLYFSLYISLREEKEQCVRASERHNPLFCDALDHKPWLNLPKRGSAQHV